MARLEIYLLGFPRILIDGSPLDTERRKAIALLAYLGMSARPQGREHLAAFLWPDYERESAFAYLRRTTWELNHALGKGWLDSDRDSLALPISPNLWLDCIAFDSLSARISDVDALTQAAELYRDDFLADFYLTDTQPFEEWQLQERQVFQRKLGQTLEHLVELRLKRGESEVALPYAQRWLGLDTLNEAAHRALMRLYAGMGSRSEVIRQYESCTKILKAELGLAPQKETSLLYEQLLHTGSQVAGFPGISLPEGKEDLHIISPGAKSPIHLPEFPTPFIGRRAEVEQVKSLLLKPTQKLVTLIGPGGTGKTRLSIQAGTELAALFSDGAWFVPLAGVSNLDGLVVESAKALDFCFYKKEERPRQQLLEYLWEKELLLILDNFEDLLNPDGLKFITDLLSTARRVKILVTSRLRLNLQSEQLFPVGGMEIPDPQLVAVWEHPEHEAQSYSGMALFIERARRIQPAFQLDRKSLAQAAQICQLVDGLPLGIELATTWLELLSPAEIAVEIQHNLDFLASEASDLPDRQRSLRAVFDSSWNLLSLTEQEAFLSLCVFPGNFSKEAGAEVSGASLRTLLKLADKSWLGASGEGRYTLHPLLRQYGIEHLSADQAAWQTARNQHAEYFVAFIEQQGKALRSSIQLFALEAIHAELGGNLSLAWEWMVEQGRIGELIERMLPGLFHFYMIRQSEEFISMLRLAIKAFRDPLEGPQLVQWAILETVEITFCESGYFYGDQPKARFTRLWQQVHTADLAQAMGFWYVVLIATFQATINAEMGAQVLQNILPTIDADADPWARGFGYLLYSSIARDERLEIRRGYALRALELFREIGVLHEQGQVLHLLGEFACNEEIYPLGFEYMHAAMAIYEQVGDILGIAYTLFDMSETYIDIGEIDQGFYYCQQNRKVYEKIGNRRMIGVSLSWESMAAARYKSLEYALETRQRSLEISIEVGNPHDIAWHTWEMGEIYRLMGNFEQARHWFQKAGTLFEQMSDLVMLSFYWRGLGDIALNQGDYHAGRDCFLRSLESIRSDERRTALWARTYALSGLGRALVGLDEFDLAEKHLHQAAEKALDWGSHNIKFLPLLGLAELASRRGQPAKALMLASVIVNHPASWNETKTQARRVIEAVATQLSPAEQEAALQHAQDIHLQSLI